MISRIRSDIFFKGIISVFIAVTIAYLPNYQYFLYQMQNPVSKKTVEESSMYFYTGYPAGDDITEVNSVKEIEENSYFTIVIDKEKLKATDYFMLIDKSEAGIHYASGRYASDTYISAYLNGKFKVMMNNNIHAAYGQFYVAELDSGEKIIVYLDHAVLSTWNKKSIRLPIGKREQYVTPGYFYSIQEEYGVDKENIKWFVNMTGINWYQTSAVTFLIYFRLILAIAIIVINYRILSRILRNTSYLYNLS